MLPAWSWPARLTLRTTLVEPSCAINDTLPSAARAPISFFVASNSEPDLAMSEPSSQQIDLKWDRLIDLTRVRYDETPILNENIKRVASSFTQNVTRTNE